jgi:hypothetical protein
VSDTALIDYWASWQSDVDIAASLVVTASRRLANHAESSKRDVTTTCRSMEGVDRDVSPTSVIIIQRL